jgi:all-trans-retinol dehydrogenase (NAD+)
LGAIVVCVDINEDSNQETVKLVQEAGGMAFGYTCDVSLREQVESLNKAIHSEVGDVNILINNAGVLYCRPFLQHTANQIEQIVQTNLMGK